MIICSRFKPHIPLLLPSSVMDLWCRAGLVENVLQMQASNDAFATNLGDVSAVT